VFCPRSFCDRASVVFNEPRMSFEESFSGKDIFKRVLDADDEKETHATTPNGLTYSKPLSASDYAPILIRHGWTVHKIIKPSDLNGLIVLKSSEAKSDFWIKWVVQDEKDEDFGKIYFEHYSTGETAWELEGVTISESKSKADDIESPVVQNSPLAMRGSMFEYLGIEVGRAKASTPDDQALSNLSIPKFARTKARKKTPQRKLQSLSATKTGTLFNTRSTVRRAGGASSPGGTMSGRVKAAKKKIFITTLR